MRLISYGVVFLAANLLLAEPAAASDEHHDDGRSEETVDCLGGPSGFWERSTLPGDFGGVRSALCKKGIQLSAIHIGEFLTNPIGGQKRGGKYQGRTELDLDLDFDKMAGVSGLTVHASSYWLQGGRLGEKSVGSLMAVSNIEAVPSLRLYTLWAQQSLWNDAVNLRIGQLAADDDFLISTGAANFVNSTFGWAPLVSSNLPSSGPVFPLAAPGARLKLAFTDEWSWKVGVFTVEPAGRPNGQPAHWRNHDGTLFSFAAGTFDISELAYSINQGKDDTGLAGTYKLGAWYASNRYNDQRWDSTGTSLASPNSSGVGKPIRGNWGIYGVIDQMLVRTGQGPDQGLSAFLRGGGAPSDRNVVAWDLHTGLTLKGPLESRPDDLVGIAFTFASISNSLQDLDRDNRFFNNLPTRPVRDYESVIELTYQAALTPWWVLQPDFQYIIHPGGNVPNPNSEGGLKKTENAVVMGVRTTLKF
jgi:porin